MKPVVFRSTAAFVFAWAWLAFVAINLVDIALRGDDAAAVIATGALLLGAGVAYVVGLRPRVVADDEGVRLHNPLRDIRLPWHKVDKVEATHAIEVHSDDQVYRAWALQTSPRARLRAEAKARRGADLDSSVPDKIAEHLKGKMPTDFAADQLNQLAEQKRGGLAESTTAAASVSLWWPAVIALALPAVLLAVSIVVAVLA
ncbi:MAG TPA: PH domain-containing protein [Streptosporangiaceae bacterium]